ncbi:pyridoxal-phosphate dependent enzyme [Streptomyces sp. O3]
MPSLAAVRRVVDAVDELIGGAPVVRPGRSPGATVVESASGGAGVALAALAAVRGCRCTVVVPHASASPERVALLRSLGADVVRTVSGHAAIQAIQEMPPSTAWCDAAS